MHNIYFSSRNANRQKTLNIRLFYLFNSQLQCSYYLKGSLIIQLLIVMWLRLVVSSFFNQSYLVPFLNMGKRGEPQFLYFSQLSCFLRVYPPPPPPDLQIIVSHPYKNPTYFYLLQLPPQTFYQIKKSYNFYKRFFNILLYLVKILLQPNSAHLCH